MPSSQPTACLNILTRHLKFRKARQHVCRGEWHELPWSRNRPHSSGSSSLLSHAMAWLDRCPRRPHPLEYLSRIHASRTTVVARGILTSQRIMDRKRRGESRLSMSEKGDISDWSGRVGIATAAVGTKEGGASEPDAEDVFHRHLLTPPHLSA